jgi:hypothetical protein
MVVAISGNGEMSEGFLLLSFSALKLLQDETCGQHHSGTFSEILNNRLNSLQSNNS